ncbi:hypothetical protein FDP41_012128 [Naegleria fowleri]|uniref:Uncharacterized protein n=1 Tax=Naegleria fowleri TaxID=5763 RepID=A0A6A5C356_NAEFO|nr:uncharacterized protein FDP41_012128 [Naegleria fowleri]KAF0981471.1 hypothetical protein FDP41_012128 [Naegleria fowleri]
MGQPSSSLSHHHHSRKRQGYLANNSSVNDDDEETLEEDPHSRRQTIVDTPHHSSDDEEEGDSNNHHYHHNDHDDTCSIPSYASLPSSLGHPLFSKGMFQSMTSQPSSPNHYVDTKDKTTCRQQQIFSKKKNTSSNNKNISNNNNNNIKREFSSPRKTQAVVLDEKKNNETSATNAYGATCNQQQQQNKSRASHHPAKHYSIGIGNAIHMRLKQKIEEHDGNVGEEETFENHEEYRLEMMIMTEEDMDEDEDENNDGANNPNNDGMNREENNAMRNNHATTNMDLRNNSVFTTTSTNSSSTTTTKNNYCGDKRKDSSLTYLPSDDDFDSYNGTLTTSAVISQQQPSSGSNNVNNNSNRTQVHSGQYQHHRRSSSIDYSAIGTANVSSHGNHYQSKMKSTVETTTCSSTGSLNVASSDRVATASISPPHHASELISTSLVHEMTFVEEEMDPKEERLWSENDEEISELWKAIPKSYHAGINRVYLKLKNRFKNDIDITDQQMRQMACDLGFSNFFYEYMFARLEPTVFALLHEEYVLKKKKNRKNMRMERYANRSNMSPGASSVDHSQEDKKTSADSVTSNKLPTTATTTNTTTIPIASKNSPQQQRIVEYKTLSSSPVLPRTELLNRLFNDTDEVETKKPEAVRLLSSFDEYINVDQDMKFEKAIKVKLIITEVGKSPGRIRTAASPLMSRLKVFDQFGWFHTSFSIGNLRFDWTNSGYCSVTTVKSATSLLAITCREIWSLRELEGILKLLSIEISRWNRNFTYTNLKGSVEKETGSCQTFTVEMMKAIGVADLTFVGNSSIHNFLRDLLQRGNPITKFSINEAFREKYFKLIDAKIEQVKIQNVVTSSELLLNHMPIITYPSSNNNNSTETDSNHSSDTIDVLQTFVQKQQHQFEAKKQKMAEIKRWEHFQSYYFGPNKKYIIFTSHRELDGFVHCLKEVDENFKDTQEYGLLNAFDRGFWLRYSHSVSIMQRIQQRKKQRETVRSKLGFRDPLALTKEEQEEYVRIKRDLEICQPLVTGNDFNCAFGDPVSSRSLFIPSTKRSDVLDIQQDIQIGSLKL